MELKGSPLRRVKRIEVDANWSDDDCTQSSGSDYTVDPQRDQQRKALADTVFKPDPLAGSLNYSYPLNVPPGRNGLQPDLSLSYSSQPGSDVNTVG